VLRIIYAAAWVARGWDAPSLRAGFPTFGTEAYWAAGYEEFFGIFEALDS
jgi:hypothetical protein